MSSVAVVTDSVADLPPDVAEELGITVVPLVVRFGSEVYLDGIDISPDQFYAKLETSKILPVTSVSPPAAFADAFYLGYMGFRESEIQILSPRPKLKLKSP